MTDNSNQLKLVFMEKISVMDSACQFYFTATVVSRDLTISCPLCTVAFVDQCPGTRVTRCFLLSISHQQAEHVAQTQLSLSTSSSFLLHYQVRWDVMYDCESALWSPPGRMGPEYIRRGAKYKWFNNPSKTCPE